MYWIFFNKTYNFSNGILRWVGKLWPFFDDLYEQIDNRIWSYLVGFVLEILSLDCRVKILGIVLGDFVQKLIVNSCPLDAFIDSLPKLFELFHFIDLLGESCYALLLMSNHDRYIFGVFFYPNHRRLEIINLLLRIAFTEYRFFNIIISIVRLMGHFDFLFGQRLTQIILLSHCNILILQDQNMA